MLKKVKNFLPLTVLVLPMFVFAQDAISILSKIRQILGYIVPIIMTLALIYFFWGLIKYISKAGDEEAQKEARGMMIYGVIILFVMASVWGLVGVIGRSFGIGQLGAPP